MRPDNAIALVIQVEVESRREAAGGDPSDTFEQEFGEVWGFELAPGWRQADGLVDGLRVFRGRDPAKGFHPAENPFLPGFGGVEVPTRIQAGWGLGDAGEEGALGQAEMAWRRAEIVLGSGIDTAVEVSVVESVRVGGENLVLGPNLFEPECLDCLPGLRPQGASTGVGKFDQLLRDGGRPADDPTVPGPLEGRPYAGAKIDAAVFTEPRILGRESRGDQGGRQGGFAGRVVELPARRRGGPQEDAVAIHQFQSASRWIEQRRRQRNESNADRHHDSRDAKPQNSSGEHRPSAGDR